MAKRMIKGVDIETSSGNVFADLGFSRAACKLPRPNIHSAIRKPLGLAKLNTESPGQVRQALDGNSCWLDFADALHLAASMADEGMLTFDAQVVGVATAAGRDVHLAS